MTSPKLPAFIGREAEQKILENAYQSNEAEMVAVIGRRRVLIASFGIRHNEHNLGVVDKYFDLDALFELD